MLRVLVTSLCFHFPCSSHPRNITPPASGTCAASAGTGDFSRHCYHTAQYHTPASVQQQQVPVILAGIVITPRKTHPCKSASATAEAGTGIFCRQCYRPPAIPHPCKCAAAAIICTSKCYHTPFLSHTLISASPASVRWCYHTPWLTTSPSWALRPARYHPGYMR